MENLADPAYCTARGLTTERIFSSLSRDIAHAVSHMHRKGVYHHDIKLRNTGFVQKGESIVFKLFDFGSALTGHVDPVLSRLADNRHFLTLIFSVLTWDVLPTRSTKRLLLSDQYETFRPKDQEAPMFELFPWLDEPIQYFSEATAQQTEEIARVPRSGGTAMYRLPYNSQETEVVLISMGCRPAATFLFVDLEAVF
jgi:serine/threonine protein kinase